MVSTVTPAAMAFEKDRLAASLPTLAGYAAQNRSKSPSRVSLCVCLGGLRGGIGGVGGKGGPSGGVRAASTSCPPDVRGMSADARLFRFRSASLAFRASSRVRSTSSASAMPARMSRTPAICSGSRWSALRRRNVALSIPLIQRPHQHGWRRRCTERSRTPAAPRRSGQRCRPPPARISPSPQPQ
jgi:hypothetical protein